MGKITLYSEMLVSDYCNAKILKDRVVCCIDTTHPHLMHKLDWFLWAYMLFELSLKKLAVFYKLNRNSRLHNSSGLFYDFFKMGLYGDGLIEFISDKLTSKGYFDIHQCILEVHKMLALDFVSLRYNTKHLDTVNTFDFQVLRAFLDCVSTLVLELETGKISIELEVP